MKIWSINLNYDLHDLISVSDGLISDISSVIIDYIPLKNPRLTTNFKNFKRGLINEIKLFSELRYHNIRNLRDFEIFFKKVKKNKKNNIDPKNVFYSKNAINSSYQIVKYFNIWFKINTN